MSCSGPKDDPCANPSASPSSLSASPSNPGAGPSSPGASPSKPDEVSSRNPNCSFNLKAAVEGDSTARKERSHRGSLKNCLRGDQGRCSSVAAHGIGLCRNGLGRESRAETRRRGDMSKNSASLRLSGRINLMQRETPNPPSEGGSLSNYNPANHGRLRANTPSWRMGMNPGLSTHATAFFVSSCPRVSHPQLPHSRDRRRARCFSTRRHEDAKTSCWVHPPAGPREARTGHR